MADVPVKGYTVTNVVERLVPTPGGRFENVLEITFTNPHGTYHTIQVKREDASPDKIKALIQGRINQLEAIYNL